jgi:hypothetical protein
MPETEVERVVRIFRQQVIDREDAQLEKLASHWLDIERRLDDEMVSLAEAATRAAASGIPVDEAWIRRQSRWLTMKTRAEREFHRFNTGIVIPDVDAERFAYAELGTEMAGDLLVLLAGDFNRLSTDAVNTFVANLANGSPLDGLLREAWPDAADGLMKGLVSGLATGKNPVETAGLMADKFGIGLSRVNCIARTETLRAFRMSSTNQYRESGVVTKFKRMARKDSVTCLGCILQDGMIYNTEDELDDHPNGRCAVVPIVEGVKEPEWTTGETWFRNQPDNIQREMMGPGMFDAWKNGEFDLQDISTTHENSTWGGSPAIIPLNQI